MTVSFRHPNADPTLAEQVKLIGMGTGLENAIRGLAQDHARIKLENAGIADFTDSTSGAAAADAAAVAVQAAAFDAGSAGGALRTDFNTQITQIRNGLAVMADHCNNVRARLGLAPMVWSEGTIAAAGTIPAITKTVTTTSGATSLDYAEGVAVMTAARNNLATLVVGLNEIASAIGEPVLTEATLGTPARTTHTLEVLASAAAAASPYDSAVSKAAADIWFTAMAANMASMALKWNLMFNQGALTVLTTAVTGDTISNTLAAMTVPVAYVTAGSDCAPKAGFDTAIDLIGNNIADLSLRANLLLARYGFTLLDYAAVDGTANTALEDHLHDLVETAGSTNCVEDATGIARCTAIRNAIASLGAKVNMLAPYFGAIRLTDSSGGTASDTIAAIGTATATGVSGATGGNESLVGATASGVDAFLLACKNAEASIYSKLNEMAGTASGVGFFTKPLHTVAGYDDNAI